MIKITKENVLEYKDKRLLTNWFGKLEEMKITDVQIIEDKMYICIFRVDREMTENYKWMNLTNSSIEVLGVIEDWKVADKIVEKWIKVHKNDKPIKKSEEGDGTKD